MALRLRSASSTLDSSSGIPPPSRAHTATAASGTTCRNPGQHPAQQPPSHTDCHCSRQNMHHEAQYSHPMRTGSPSTIRHPRHPSHHIYTERNEDTIRHATSRPTFRTHAQCATPLCDPHHRTSNHYASARHAPSGAPRATQARPAAAAWQQRPFLQPRQSSLVPLQQLQQRPGQGGVRAC